jgi:NAD(P)-dependent dehydrogenase (short-subunit alcohol dehydrogenase family)
MAGRLQDKIALLTGGGAGLSEATTKRFAEEEAAVIVTAMVIDGTYTCH